MQIFSEECDTKKNNGGALFGGGALYGENTVILDLDLSKSMI